MEGKAMATENITGKFEATGNLYYFTLVTNA